MKNCVPFLRAGVLLGLVVLLFGAPAQAEESSVAPNKEGCESSNTRLCISDEPGDQRFAITVAWATTQGDGGEGFGRALSLESLGIRRGGMFWFFSPDNPELLIKVLDGCTITNHYWVFWSAGTTVGLEMTVDDTFTGTQKIYRNTDGTAAEPVADRFAFPCG